MLAALGARRGRSALRLSRLSRPRVLNTKRSFTSSTLTVDNPYTGATYCEVGQISNESALNQLESSQNAFQSFRKTPLRERQQLCESVLQHFHSKRGKIARDITGQMGKPLKQALGEVNTMIERGRRMIAMSDEALADRVISSQEEIARGVLRKITREPVGVVMCLAPWNYPLLCSINTIMAAVLAGCSVVVKQSSRTPLCADHFAEAFESTGGPKQLVQAFHAGHDVVARSIKHPAVAYVAFTGSVGGGRSIASSVAQAPRFIEAALELGGKDPAYVADDADLDKAVSGIVDGACYNAGQSCCGVKRVYVHQSLYEQFLQRATELFEEYQLGDPLSESTTMGPLAQPNSADELREQVKDAVASGARLLHGGKKTTDDSGQGRFFRPALIADANHSMRVMKEESFGPVLAVMPVRSDEQAVKMMNDSAFGLTSSIWTSSRERALNIAPQLDTGTVFHNKCDYLDPDLPWSGRKDSGKGISLSVLGFNAVTRTKGYSFH